MTKLETLLKETRKEWCIMLNTVRTDMWEIFVYKENSEGAVTQSCNVIDKSIEKGINRCLSILLKDERRTSNGKAE